MVVVDWPRVRTRWPPDARGKRDAGEGLPREVLPTYRGQLAVATLASALVAFPEFLEQADLVVSGADPLEVAVPYSRRKSRRRVIARFMEAAAGCPEMPDQAMTSLAQVRAVTIDARDRPKRLPYYIEASFEAAITRGALSIARRGAGRCVLCASPYIGFDETQRRTVRGEMRFQSVKVPRFHCEEHARLPASMDDDVAAVYRVVGLALRAEIAARTSAVLSRAVLLDGR